MSGSLTENSQSLYACDAVLLRLQIQAHMPCQTMSSGERFIILGLDDIAPVHALSARKSDMLFLVSKTKDVGAESP